MRCARACAGGRGVGVLCCAVLGAVVVSAHRRWLCEADVRAGARALRVSFNGDGDGEREGVRKVGRKAGVGSGG